MNDSTLTGLTWGHRRATAPLDAASRAYREATGKIVDWQSRDLRRFEHEPLHVIARSFDLVVFDHPFCGVVAQSGCFMPLPPAWLKQVLGDDPGALFMGRSYNSYAYAGRVWGLPIDAACNHAVYRKDLLDEYGSPPMTWEAVIALGRSVRQRGQWLAIGAADHHSFLAVAALMANTGHGMPEGSRRSFSFDGQAFLAALDRFRSVFDLCAPESIGWNSIGLHDAMAARDDLVYCPIAYGFATYGEADIRARLHFAALPGETAPFGRGAVLGGAGIAISATCPFPEATLDYLAFLALPETQLVHFGRHSGQPARIEAWVSADLDARFSGYFSSTAPSMLHCSMRPRFVGYQQFEERAGRIVENGLLNGIPSDAIAAAVAEEAARVRRGELAEPYASLIEAD